MVPEVFKTLSSVPYLKDPGVVFLAKTVCADAATSGLGQFLTGLDPEFSVGFDDFATNDDDAPRGGAELVQLAGQLCYLSFGEKRTPFSENERYIRKILDSGHGSVTEHANYTLLFYGVDRACTHELVRHRAGMAYSQVSQRFVDGRHLRFVMPFEYRQNVALVQEFEEEIDRAAATYEARAEALKAQMPKRSEESPTEWRKRIQSCARECLPNSTEAPIVVTGNARSWRHVLSMRCAKGADVRIRRPMVRALALLQKEDPNLFADFRTFDLPDGSIGAEAEFPKP